MEDNLYQTSSEKLLGRPESQKKREEEEKIRYEREKPLLTELKTYLEAQISHYKTIDAVKVSELPPEMITRQIMANKAVVEILTRELNAIRRLEMKHGKK